MKKIWKVIIMFSLSSLLGCSGISPEKYLDLKPQFSLEEFFSGPIRGWGIIQDRSGNVIERFDAVMHGKWEGEKGELDEHFVYYDGTKKHRLWKITKTGQDSYDGRADDIIGVAHGTSYGNAIRWTYEMDIAVGKSTYRIFFDDWMWLMNDGLVVNRSYMKKFGVTVGELTVVMKKES